MGATHMENGWGLTELQKRLHQVHQSPVLDSTIEVLHYCVMGACCGKQAGADGGLGSATSAATSQPTRPQRRPAAEANNLSR